jgi:hypothetical protein
MRVAILAACCLGVSVIGICAEEAPDYAARLKALTKGGTAHENPELEALGP